MFNANEVPVGHDQLQHLEIARDIASTFNYLYAPKNKPFFTLPQATGGSADEVLPGLDGRKMSKSYNNVIPLFEGGRAALDEAISRIVTDSRLPGERKDPDSTSLTVIYEAFSTPEESKTFREALVAGMGWGEAKKQLADKIDAEIGPMRERYNYLMSHPEELEDTLLKGAAKARVYAQELMEKLREAVGLRSFVALPSTAKEKTEKKTVPVIKQFRESDGLFYFKLTFKNTDFFLSQGFVSGAEAGQWVKTLKSSPEKIVEAPVTLSEGITLAAAQEVLTLFNVD